MIQQHRATIHRVLERHFFFIPCCTREAHRVALRQVDLPLSDGNFCSIETLKHIPYIGNHGVMQIKVEESKAVGGRRLLTKRHGTLVTKFRCVPLPFWVPLYEVAA